MQGYRGEKLYAKGDLNEKQIFWLVNVCKSLYCIRHGDE